MKRSVEHALSGEEPKKRQARLGNDGSVTTKFTLPPNIGQSQKIEDRASVFQSFFIPIRSPNEISSFVKRFRQSSLCDGVDHAILAYRVLEPGAGLELGADDDGERFASKKLADLLELMDVYGLVIVIRHYGGIMLGPIRFQHITQCAREAIMDYRRVKSIQAAEADRTRRLLAARDKTIATLREITRKKREDLANEEGAKGLLPPDATQSTTAGSQEPPKDYSEYDLIVLRRLLVARDMTIKSLRTALGKMTTTTDPG